MLDYMRLPITYVFNIKRSKQLPTILLIPYHRRIDICENFYKF